LAACGSSTNASHPRCWGSPLSLFAIRHIIRVPSSCLFCHLVIWEFALSIQSPISWRCVLWQYRTLWLYTTHASDSDGTGFNFSWRPVILIEDFFYFTNFLQ
jgi:hypothetical protein